MLVAFRGRPLVLRVGMMAAAVAVLLAVAGWQWSAGRTEARLNEDLFVQCLTLAQTPGDARQCSVDFYERRDQQLAQTGTGRTVAAGVLLAEGYPPGGPAAPPDTTRPQPPGTPSVQAPATTADPHLASTLPDRPDAPTQTSGGGEVVSVEPPSAPEPTSPAEEPVAAPAPTSPVTEPATTCAVSQATSSAGPRSCPADPMTSGPSEQGGQGVQTALTPVTGPGRTRPATSP